MRNTPQVTFLSFPLVLLVARVASLVSPHSPPLPPLLALPQLPIQMEGMDRRGFLIILIGQLLLREWEGPIHGAWRRVRCNHGAWKRQYTTHQMQSHDPSHDLIPHLHKPVLYHAYLLQFPSLPLGSLGAGLCLLLISLNESQQLLYRTAIWTRASRDWRGEGGEKK